MKKFLILFVLSSTITFFLIALISPARFNAMKQAIAKYFTDRKTQHNGSESYVEFDRFSKKGITNMKGRATIILSDRTRKDSFKMKTIRCTIKSVNGSIFDVTSLDKGEDIYVMKGEIHCNTPCGYFKLRKDDFMKVRPIIGNKLPTPLTGAIPESIRKQCNNTLVQIYSGVDAFESPVD